MHLRYVIAVFSHHKRQIKKIKKQEKVCLFFVFNSKLSDYMQSFSGLIDY